MIKVTDYMHKPSKNLFCQPNDTLTSLVHHLDRPTSTVFVSEDQKTILGIIAPTHLFYNNRSLPNTKAAQVMITPPYIDHEMDLAEVAALMASEQIYTLPVCEDKNIVGYINILDIKTAIADSPDQSNIAKNIRVKSPNIITIEDSIRNAISTMKNQNTQWLITATQKGKPNGIIHVGHLLEVMLIDDNKQRFGKNKIPWTNWSFDTEPHEMVDRQIANLITPEPTPIVTKIDENRILKELLTEHTNVVTVIEDGVISGVVTIRDVCTAYSKSFESEEVSIVIKRPSESVTDHDFLRAQEELRHFVQKMQKRLPIQRIEVGVEEPKYSTRETAVYNTAITVIPYTSGTYYAQGHEKIFSYSIRSALKQIEKQQQRNHDEKTNYAMPSIGEITREQTISSVD